MTGAGRRAAWLALVLLILFPCATYGQARDAAGQRQVEPVGTSSIAGRVLVAGEAPRPLPRAVVELTEAARIIQPRVVTSDEGGKFIFRNLPPGRYSISATRAPYLRGVFGMKRIAGPGSVQTGTTIVVAAAQSMTGIDVTLFRGAVITGTVRDTDGGPARGVPISAFYFSRSSTTTERHLVTQGRGDTDDRGVFRIYGLPPGSYIIGAIPSANTGGGEATVTTDADLARAADMNQRQGIAAPSPTASAAPMRRATGTYAAVYFPGVVDVSSATPVTVDAAQEQSGVDLQMQFVHTARIEGTLSGPTGSVKQGIQIRAAGMGEGLARARAGASAHTDAGGRFALAGLPPGAYLVQTMAQAPDGTRLWAGAEVTMSGTDRQVDLALQPGVTVKGKIAFDGTSRKPIDPTKLRVGLVPDRNVPNSQSFNPSPSAAGEFEIQGVVPARYRISLTQPVPSIESGWWVTSVLIGGVDALENGAEIPAAPTVSVSVVLSDRVTEIAGTMMDRNGPAPEYFIIAFSADQAHWTTDSRRIMQTRPSSDGSFVFHNLPAGEYRLAAVTELQNDDLLDHAFLTQLLTASVKVVLPEQGKVRQDLKIR